MRLTLKIDGQHHSTVARVGSLVLAVGALALGQADRRASVAERVGRLTRDSGWTETAAVPLRFRTHHPQGLVGANDAFYLSSVEVKTRTRRFAAPVDGLDRDAGAGTGHLFRFDRDGRLLGQVTLGEGTIYHPGGIDYDGAHVWVPVAEYRPNSRSIVYRVDPRTMTAAEVFRVPDHIGAIVHDTDDGALYGVSWGSRRFYRWALAEGGQGIQGGASDARWRVNGSHYVDYQDCKYVGGRRMLCTGVADLRPAGTGGLATALRLGGLELVDLGDGRPLHQVPVRLWTTGGVPLTQNATWFEPTATGLRGYFLPEDDTSTLYVYEVE
ncbi:MAG TPA: DUF6454 family protein [Vicinamibacterales bacterium]|nr:DUF6454 family protein [Vicinamibacterales bacterium]